LITYDVTLCIGAKNPDASISVKCHDTGVNLWVNLVTRRNSKWIEVSEPYSIPAGATAVLKIAKPDKTRVIVDGDIESDSILFRLPPQSFTAAGRSKAEVSLFGSDGRRITSTTLNILVSEECVCECQQESETYVDLMAEQIQSAKDAAETASQKAEETGKLVFEAEAAKDAATKAAERAEQAATSNGFAEFAVGEDGHLYLLRTTNIADTVDFELVGGRLEVIIHD